MQGTYNALAGLVALSVKCTGYNNTYVSKGFAFENALHDAILRLKENKSSTFLVAHTTNRHGVPIHREGSVNIITRKSES